MKRTKNNYADLFCRDEREWDFFGLLKSGSVSATTAQGVSFLNIIRMLSDPRTTFN